LTTVKIAGQIGEAGFRLFHHPGTGDGKGTMPRDPD
jgi:hypothetical protein